MPGKSARKKDLYLGKCMADLNKLSECKDLGNNVAVIVKSADKTFREAVHQDELSDEERAYVLYMRYFNVISLAKKKPEYFKQKEYYDNLIGRVNQMNAIERAEKLSQSLKERYDLIEAEAVANKLAALEESKQKKREEEKLKEKEKRSTNGENKENGVPADKPEKEPGSISAMELFSQLNNKEVQIIIMDTRSTQDFGDSHINHKSCINVPEEILEPGTTVTHISTSLPSGSKSLWKQRGEVDHVVLIDWRSSLKEVKVGTTLQTLRDALYKYDASVKLKNEPLILQGGYEQWLLFYPTVTTNPHVLCPAKPEDYITSSGLDFDYPDFDEPAVEKPPVNSQSGSSIYPSATNGSALPGLPSVDRSLKPKPGGKSVNEAPLNNKLTESKVNNHKNANIEPQTDKVDGFSRIENSLYPDVRQISRKTVTRNEMKKETNVEMESKKARNDSADIERELAELSVIKRQKEEELSEFQDERKRMTAEHRARITRLEAEEEKLRKLETLRQKEEKDVAELLRKKKTLQEEIRMERTKQMGEEERKQQEERIRVAELDSVRKQEDEKRQRQQEVERMRRERRKKEDEQKKSLERDAAERNRMEEEENEEFAREEKARQERERQEKERRKNEEERKKKEELKIQQLKKEKQDQEQKIREEQEAKAKLEKERAEKELADRLRHEEAERAKAERAKAERDQKLAAERAQKIAEDKLKKIGESTPQSKKIITNNLPVGWEKRLDRSTNRYFYINHNQGTTQWEPPAFKQPSAGDTYTTKLKEEPIQPSRGLSRSFSSPDIMKQLNEEGDEPFISPNIDRTQKPSQRFESVRSRPAQRQYIVKKRDLQPVYGSVGPALTGLRNLGNTCYMNSTIQCLNNCTPLVVYFLNDLYLKDINRESSQGMHGEMVDDYAVVVKALWNGQYRCITPRDLKMTVGKYSPMFAGFSQQDSQEFLTFLLDGLHEGLNEIKTPPKVPDQENDNVPDQIAAELAWRNHKLVHRSIIVELFQGQLKSTLQCKHCNKMSVTFQAFMFLSLPIPNHGRISLKDCLNEFLKPEFLTGSCKWKCPRCNVERDAVKKIDLWKLPPILLIGLNRFYSDGMWMSKKTNHVDFPVFDLDLRDYVKDPKSRMKYNLYGISNHYGTMEGGHYTAYCRNPCSKKWYSFDDAEVKEMSPSDVKTSAAFVLYYTSIELTAPKYKPQL